ncbi:MAG: LysM peptidoglycan-binding domain-containing protein, partial [Anaerolineae bacterium]
MKTWKNRKILLFTGALLGLSVLFSPLWVNAPAHAQENPPEGAVYRVEAGDTLWSIALRFGVSADALREANQIANPNQLFVGQELRIPGISGVNGYLVSVEIPPGETVRSLARRYAITPQTLARLNRLTSPMQLYAGGNLILPEAQTDSALGRRVVLGAGESPLMAAAALGTSPWVLALQNDVPSPVYLLPMDVLLTPGEARDSSGALPPPLDALTFNASLIQGHTAVFQVSAPPEVHLEGNFLGHPLRFFPLEDGAQVALQGIPALQEPGVYPLRMVATLPDGTRFVFEQNVPIAAGDYLYDPP